MLDHPSALVLDEPASEAGWRYKEAGLRCDVALWQEIATAHRDGERWYGTVWTRWRERGLGGRGVGSVLRRRIQQGVLQGSHLQCDIRRTTDTRPFDATLLIFCLFSCFHTWYLSDAHGCYRVHADVGDLVLAYLLGLAPHGPPTPSDPDFRSNRASDGPNMYVV